LFSNLLSISMATDGKTIFSVYYLALDPWISYFISSTCSGQTDLTQQQKVQKKNSM